MEEYLQLKHMKVSSRPVDDFNYYLPHHGVFRADSNKIRVVFNASRKTSSGSALNDLLLPGRKLQPDITHVISRWRFGRAALVTDVVKMFRQFLVHPEDLDWQRLLWRDSTDTPIKDYVALTVTYGLNCAPYLAMRSILQLAEDGRHSHPLAYLILTNQIYIDDIFLAADHKEQVIAQRNQLIDLLATAGLQLGKWSSSLPELIQGLPGGGVCDFPSPSGDIVSTLGLKWDTNAYEFLFETILPPLTSLISKRTVLSDTARLFDPLGFIAPVIIQAKIFLQDLWIKQLDWDAPLSRELLERWLTFRSALLRLPEIRIPRWTGASRGKDWHLHGFADASMRAYAAVIYAVVPGSAPTLLMSKTRVAPVKVETLPRLELCGATLLTRLAKHLISGMLQAPSSVTFWSDSKVVLDWLQSHASRWPTFIANRVSEISTSFPDAAWRHVRSKDNPADCATRGLSPQELADFTLWWRGPVWLPSPPPDERDQPTKSQEQYAHALPAAAVPVESMADDDVLSHLEKFSSVGKILRVLGYILRWRLIINRKFIPAVTRLAACELREAKLTLFRLIQSRYFRVEISCILAGKQLPGRSVLPRLSPYLDAQGLLRVGGRLHHAPLPEAERHPIILAGRCYIMRLLVEETHRLSLHGGVQLMKSLLHRTYWIIQGSRLISSVYRRCVRCIRHGATPLQQQMAPLPADRLSQGRPFSATGLDYAGPFPLLFSKGRGAKTTKGYVAIFICFVTKAVHIEVVSDLTSDTFIAAIYRFTARRGLCSVIFSNNGTTFRGADAELRRLFDSTSMFSKEVFAQLATRGTEWKFIPPRTPHFGGLWEAAVRSFKYHLRRVIGAATLTFEEFSTLAAKIEACLNSRPLCPISAEAHDPVALTPGHFLVGSPTLTFPEPLQDLTAKVTLNNRWRLVSQLRDSFWVRWRKEVLAQLQQRNKWLKLQPNLQRGDIVIITDELSPPATWPLAIVSETHPGKDGLVRVVTVRTSTSTFVRPIVKLVRLSPDEETSVFFACFSASTHLIETQE